MIVNKAQTRTRAEELVNMGFGVADAAHVAFAEKAGALFISCDNKLVKKMLKSQNKCILRQSGCLLQDGGLETNTVKYYR